MKALSCSHCRYRVFFDNTSCTHCGAVLGFLPGEGMLAFSLPPADAPAPEGSWQRLGSSGAALRPCANYVGEQVCNWMVEADDPHPLCRSCRLTRVIPDLGPPGNRALWAALEQAKRRFVCTVLERGLALVPKSEDEARGLAFDFLQTLPEQPDVLTGHSMGVITLNVAEADDAVREQTRLAMHEPYRTLLGHFRHESGHYFWDRLIAGTRWLKPFRARFGDERADYAAALAAHYQQQPADWPEHFVSAYASSHPWEDWAETWAHYWHIVDGLETAAAWGLALNGVAPGLRPVYPRPLRASTRDAIGRIVGQWLPVARFVNAMDRSLGTKDSYPFLLSTPALDKLAFVHRVVRAAVTAPRRARSPSALAGTGEAMDSAAAADDGDAMDALDAAP
ncbi:MAG: putative zinc-binding peptidase [Burkholderiaceae bacterium]